MNLIEKFFARRRLKNMFGNTLTPSVVDPNSFTPEYKTFLVNLEKVS